MKRRDQQKTVDSGAVFKIFLAVTLILAITTSQCAAECGSIDSGAILANSTDTSLV